MYIKLQLCTHSFRIDIEIFCLGIVTRVYLHNVYTYKLLYIGLRGKHSLQSQMQIKVQRIFSMHGVVLNILQDIWILLIQCVVHAKKEQNLKKNLGELTTETMHADFVKNVNKRTFAKFLVFLYIWNITIIAFVL